MAPLAPGRDSEGQNVIKPEGPENSFEDQFRHTKAKLRFMNELDKAEAVSSLTNGRGLLNHVQENRDKLQRPTATAKGTASRMDRSSPGVPTPTPPTEHNPVNNPVHGQPLTAPMATMVQDDVAMSNTGQDGAGSSSMTDNTPGNPIHDDKKRTYTDHLGAESPELPGPKYQRVSDNSSGEHLKEHLSNMAVGEPFSGRHDGMRLKEKQQDSAGASDSFVTQQQQPRGIAEQSQVSGDSPALSRLSIHQHNGRSEITKLMAGSRASQVVPPLAKSPIIPLSVHSNHQAPEDDLSGELAQWRADVLADVRNADEDDLFGDRLPEDSDAPDGADHADETDLPREGDENTPTPDGLSVQLFTHQRIALAWMKRMEENSDKKGGILADDMGLGKTITTLALILSRPAPRELDALNRGRDPTLIIAPVSLVKQWQHEAANKVKGSHKLKTHSAHETTGNSKKSYRELRRYDIVVTTYDKIRAEAAAMEKYTKHATNRNRAPDVQEMSKLFPFLSPRSKFHRIILDEAQAIKNPQAQRSKAMNQIVATYRWCLTGTPMMNDPMELGSLIKFLRIKPYCDENVFKREFGCLCRRGGGTRRWGYVNPEDALNKLIKLAKSIMLRRTKDTKMKDGQPIITLPPKIEVISHVTFSPHEDEYYKILEKKSRFKLNAIIRSGLSGKAITMALVLLLRLRQACCHPFLNVGQLEWFGAQETALNDMMERVKLLLPDAVEHLRGNTSFQCAVCLDTTEKPIIVPKCGHTICSPCFEHMTSSAEEIAEEKKDTKEDEDVQTDYSALCPKCGASFNLLEVSTYHAFQQVYMTDKLAPQNDGSGDKVTNNGPDHGLGTSRYRQTHDEDEVDKKGNLKGFIVDDDDDQVDYLEKSGDDSDNDSVVDLSKQEPKRRQNNLLSLTVERAKTNNADNHNRYIDYLRREWVDSAKVSKCMEVLTEIQKTGEKTIIFSQWNMLLDILQVPIGDMGLEYRCYTGSMSSKRRNEAVHDFTSNPDIKVMLISLKAGNAGLNLTAASNVIIMDPFWNPFIESQAVDRTYRIGQTREVKVHRILVKKTVEDRIIKLQTTKRKLVEAALSEKGIKGIGGGVDAKELLFLFGLDENEDEDE